MHDLLRRDPQIWDLFTRKEEYDNPLRDQYDRFPYYASKDRGIFKPKASQYLAEHGYSVQYPDDAPFAVCLTHDIDVTYQSVRSKGISALRALKNGKPSSAVQSISRMRSKKLPLCNFAEIMDIEEKFEAKSTFFFMAEGPEYGSYLVKVAGFEDE